MSHIIPADLRLHRTAVTTPNLSLLFSFRIRLSLSAVYRLLCPYSTLFSGSVFCLPLPGHVSRELWGTENTHFPMCDGQSSFDSRAIAVYFVWIRLCNYKEWYRNMKEVCHYRLNSQDSEVSIFCCLALPCYSGEGAVSSRRVPAAVSPTVSLYNTVTAVDKRMNKRTLLESSWNVMAHGDAREVKRRGN